MLISEQSQLSFVSFITFMAISIGNGFQQKSSKEPAVNTSLQHFDSLSSHKSCSLLRPSVLSANIHSSSTFHRIRLFKLSIAQTETKLLVTMSGRFRPLIKAVLGLVGASTVVQQVGFNVDPIVFAPVEDAVIELATLPGSEVFNSSVPYMTVDYVPSYLKPLANRFFNVDFGLLLFTVLLFYWVFDSLRDHYIKHGATAAANAILHGSSQSNDGVDRIQDSLVSTAMRLVEHAWPLFAKHNFLRDVKEFSVNEEVLIRKSQQRYQEIIKRQALQFTDLLKSLSNHYTSVAAEMWKSIQDKDAQILVFEEKEKTLTSKVNMLEIKLADVTGEKWDVQERLDACNGQLDMANDNLEKQKEINVKIQKCLDAKTQEFDETDKDLRLTRGKLATANADCSKLEKSEREAKARCSQHKNALDAAKEEISQLKHDEHVQQRKNRDHDHKVSMMQQTIDDGRADRTNLQRSNEALKEENQQLSFQNKALESDNQTLSTHNATLHADNDQQASRIKTLENDKSESNSEHKAELARREEQAGNAAAEWHEKNERNEATIRSLESVNADKSQVLDEIHSQLAAVTHQKALEKASFESQKSKLSERLNEADRKNEAHVRETEQVHQRLRVEIDELKAQISTLQDSSTQISGEGDTVEDNTIFKGAGTVAHLDTSPGNIVNIPSKSSTLTVDDAAPISDDNPRTDAGETSEEVGASMTNENESNATNNDTQSLHNGDMQRCEDDIPTAMDTDGAPTGANDPLMEYNNVHQYGPEAQVRPEAGTEGPTVDTSMERSIDNSRDTDMQEGGIVVETTGGDAPIGNLPVSKVNDAAVEAMAIDGKEPSHVPRLATNAVINASPNGRQVAFTFEKPASSSDGTPLDWTSLRSPLTNRATDWKLNWKLDLGDKNQSGGKNSTFTFTQAAPSGYGGPLDWDHPPPLVTNREIDLSFDLGNQKEAKCKGVRKAAEDEESLSRKQSKTTDFVPNPPISNDDTSGMDEDEKFFHAAKRYQDYLMDPKNLFPLIDAHVMAHGDAEAAKKKADEEKRLSAARSSPFHTDKPKQDLPPESPKPTLPWTRVVQNAPDPLFAVSPKAAPYIPPHGRVILNSIQASTWIPPSLRPQPSMGVMRPPSSEPRLGIPLIGPPEDGQSSLESETEDEKPKEEQAEAFDTVNPTSTAPTESGEPVTDGGTSSRKIKQNRRSTQRRNRKKWADKLPEYNQIAAPDTGNFSGPANQETTNEPLDDLDRAAQEALEAAFDEMEKR